MQKIRNAVLSPGSSWERVHAFWSINEIEGLALTGCHIPSGSFAQGWQVGGTREFYQSLRALEDKEQSMPRKFTLAQLILAQLHGQRFATRQEALQAVEVALDLIKNKDGEDEIERYSDRSIPV